MTMHRTLLLAGLALALLAGLLGPPPTVAQRPRDVTISLAAGYDGQVHGGEPFPVDITLANDGPDVSGVVEVSLANASTPWIGQPIDLPRGARKQLRMWYTDPNFGVGELHARVVVADQTVASETRTLTLLDPSVLLVGLVAGRGQLPLPGLDELLGNPTNTARLDPSQLPDLDGLLVAFDVIVLGQGNLTAAQQAALRRWVAVGGLLLIDGTSIAPVGLEALLPATLGDLVDTGALGLAPGGPARQLVALPAARPQPPGGPPLWVEQRIGIGAVRVSAAALASLPSPAVAPAMAALWRLPGATRPMLQGTGDLGLLRRRISSLALPSLGSVFLFLLVYVGLTGPGNYLVLRRLDRREWAWVSIPLSVLLFTLVAYGLGVGLRGDRPTLLNISVVQAGVGETTGLANTMLGVAAPRRGRYVVAAPAAPLAFWSNNDFFGRQLPADDRLGPAASGGVAGTLTINVGEIRQISVVSAVPVALDLDARLANGVATVVNRGASPSPRLFVVHGDRFVRLDPLAPGEQRAVADRELFCCLQSGAAQPGQTLAEDALLGQADGLFFAPNTLNLGDSWALIVVADQPAVTAQLDRDAEQLAATITILYLPEGQP